MLSLLHITARMQSIWESLADRYSAYQLALPGSPTFHCQPHTCDAYCCRAYSVNLGQAEADRFRAASGKSFVQFLECEDGAPIALPLAQPYLLRREENRCAQLGADLACGEYDGRPNACRLYPHFLLAVDTATGRPVHGDLDRIRAALESAFAPGTDAPLIPLLLRHVECPGFTGAPMSEREWRDLLLATAALQYPAQS